MSLVDKVKSLFMEQADNDQHMVSARAIGVTARKKESEEVTPELRMRKWVRSVGGTAPWAAVGIILFALFAQGAIATSALAYGLVKVSIAVLCTVIADETMFRGLRNSKDHPWLPMIRRSMVFMGICWLMAVT